MQLQMFAQFRQRFRGCAFFWGSHLCGPSPRQVARCRSPRSFGGSGGSRFPRWLPVLLDWEVQRRTAHRTFPSSAFHRGLGNVIGGGDDKLGTWPSLMPEGLEGAITVQQTADLNAFLLATH